MPSSRNRKSVFAVNCNIYIYITAAKKLSPSRRQPRGTAERFNAPNHLHIYNTTSGAKNQVFLNGRTSPISSLYAIVTSRPKINRGSG